MDKYEIQQRIRAHLTPLKAYMKKSTGRPHYDKESLRLWSVIVRSRAGACELCGKDGESDKFGRPIKGLESHHIVYRNTYRHRYTLNNGMALCSSCHQFDKDISPHIDYTSMKAFDKKFSKDKVFEHRYQWWLKEGYKRGQCVEGAEFHYYRLLDVYISMLDGESMFPGELY